MAREIDMTGITATSSASPTTMDVRAVENRPLFGDGRWSAPLPPKPPPPLVADPHGEAERETRLPVAVLSSTIIHTLLLIAFALFRFSPTGNDRDVLQVRLGPPGETTALDASVSFSASAAELAIGMPAIEIEPSSLIGPAVEAVSSATDSAKVSVSPGEITDDRVRDDAPVLSIVPETKVSMERIPSGGLEGRSPDQRQRLGQKYGASGPSEAAVDAALDYLARHQRDDGSWSFNLKLDPCDGRCDHSTKIGDTPTPPTAATGLALLAFLGAGHTHTSDGPYQENVRKGIYYLRAIASESESGYDWQRGSMYGHGIAMMALGEALAMTGGEDAKRSDLYELVEKGTQFTCIAQHHGGSWGYYPKSPGDTTVTGWQVLSLIAAKRSRVPMQTMTLADAKTFVMSMCTDRDYWFGYRSPKGEPTTTAIGLTLMLYLGDSPDYTPMMMALSEMADRGPTLDNIYHDYYATLALHHARHPDWDRWNNRLRDHLVATQVKTGHARGSWHFQDKWGDIGGRLYTTAMCALTLEVYYRYLPLYGEIEDFPL